MLKEQLLSLAIKAVSDVHQIKERIYSNFTPEKVQSHVQNLRSVAAMLLRKNFPAVIQEFTKSASTTSAEIVQKRKSSVKPAKEISSFKAEIILKHLKTSSHRIAKKSDSIQGKKSLAYLIWALGHAERCQITEGISIHDVSALLYRACKIELYPINISRVVYGNTALVRQVSQDRRTKTYLLTPEGLELFNDKFGIKTSVRKPVVQTKELN